MGRAAKESQVLFQPMGDRTLFPKTTFLLDQLEVWFFSFFKWGDKTLQLCTSGKEMSMTSAICTHFSPELCLWPFCISPYSISHEPNTYVSLIVWVLCLPLFPLGGWELKLDLLHKEHTTVQCDSAIESTMLQIGLKLNWIYKFIFLHLLTDHTA